MLSESKVYELLKDSCKIYLSSLKIKDIDKKFISHCKITVYVEVLDDKEIEKNFERLMEDFCNWYLGYYKEKIVIK